MQYTEITDIEFLFSGVLCAGEGGAYKSTKTREADVYLLCINCINFEFDEICACNLANGVVSF